MQVCEQPVNIFLQPGEYFVGNASHRVITLLGSCVSIVLWHAEIRAGAITHFLLPSRNLEIGNEKIDARYADEALSLVLEKLKALNISPSECEGKIFGGGDMFPDQNKSSTINVGRKNGEAARSLLRSHNIRMASADLYGVGHRQIIFDVSAGDVWVRQIKPSVFPFFRY